jgi:hypothetical protein
MEGADNGEKFSVMNLIVHLGRAEGAQIVADSAKLLCIGRVSPALSNDSCG